MALTHPLEEADPTPRDPPSSRVLLVDNVDSFTYNLLHALIATGVVCEVVRHDAATADELATRAWDGLVIGPGPCSPHEAGVTLPLLELLDERLDGRPVLGICLGHQALAIAAGGDVTRARRAVHGAKVTLRHDGRGCLEELSASPEVIRYNSLVVGDDLPSSLEPCAWDEHGDLMALRHRTLPREGVQFHPEAWLGPEGLPVLRAWSRRLRAPTAGARDGSSEGACRTQAGRAG